jgi:hypothetical protein
MKQIIPIALHKDKKLLLQNNVSLSDEPTLPVKPENELLFTCSKEYDTITELALKRFCICLLDKSKNLLFQIQYKKFSQRESSTNIVK